MHTIYKYQIKPSDPGIKLPLGSQVLHADTQNGEFFIWALVNLDETEFVEREFAVWGTGWEIEEYPNVDFISTVFEGPYVWHIFEILK